MVAGSNPSTSSIFNIPASAPVPVRKNGTDDFLNSENDKNDYDWYVCRTLFVGAFQSYVFFNMFSWPLCLLVQ